MICPYCEVEITMSQVDAEDGYCPECGSIMAASAIFLDNEEELDEEVELNDFKKTKIVDGVDGGSSYY